MRWPSLPRLSPGTLPLARAALGLLGVAAILVGVPVHDVLHTTGQVTDDPTLVSLRAHAGGVVARVHASVGDQVTERAPILTLDPNLSPPQAQALRLQVASEREAMARQQGAVEAISRLLQSPTSLPREALSWPGIVGEALEQLNAFSAARLQLARAHDEHKKNATQQRQQGLGGVNLFQRRIALLQRNLEISRREADVRDGAVSAKSRDFDALVKLSERGLVSAADVNRERDNLLQAQLAATDNRKQVDQIELEIGNQRLEMQRLTSQNEAAGEDVVSRLDAAQLAFDLALLRLTEYRDQAQSRLQARTEALASSEAMLAGGGEGIVIVAPLAGILTRLPYAGEGSAVAPGALVASLQPLGRHPAVLARLPAAWVGGVQAGERARVSLAPAAERPDARAWGRVRRVFSAAEGSDLWVEIGLETATLRSHGLSVALLPGEPVAVTLMAPSRSLLALLVAP